MTRPTAMAPDASTSPVGQWQPIETAPKNGTEVDLWCMAGAGNPIRVTDCAWLHRADGPDWYTRAEDGWLSLGAILVAPKFWMPLPPTPEVSHVG